jgi:hypothetical protein
MYSCHIRDSGVYTGEGAGVIFVSLFSNLAASAFTLLLPLLWSKLESVADLRGVIGDDIVSFADITLSSFVVLKRHSLLWRSSAEIAKTALLVCDLATSAVASYGSTIFSSDEQSIENG